jgi:protein-tyrosine phosphatase
LKDPKGRLAIVPRPRGGDWLEDEIERWKQSGLQVVLSLLLPDEDAHFQLEQEGAICEAHAVRFVSYPIADRSVPQSLDATAALVQELERELENGKSVGIHCRQSIGRSALIAACVMVAAGKDPDEAFEVISAARGLPVPETNEQREWVETFAN